MGGEETPQLVCGGVSQGRENMVRNLACNKTMRQTRMRGAGDQEQGRLKSPAGKSCSGERSKPLPKLSYNTPNPVVRMVGMNA